MTDWAKKIEEVRQHQANRSKKRHDAWISLRKPTEREREWLPDVPVLLDDAHTVALMPDTPDVRTWWETMDEHEGEADYYIAESFLSPKQSQNPDMVGPKPAVWELDGTLLFVSPLVKPKETNQP